ncbi:MAG: VWA domain-containing protein [Gemmatimonadota bacterium]|nr:MAG: VWA domain-containing protein [Gemmatimonadota bacterium]
MRHINARPAAATALALILLIAGARPGAAQGWIEPPVDRWLPHHHVERLRSDVTVRIDGERRVAHVEVEEVFRNNSRVMQEGDYLYPIAPEAVFTDFSLFMGEEELRGEVLPADEARRIYEEIVRRKKDPALIELVGHGVLRARVFPIEPGDTRRIILRYTQILGKDGDLLRFRYPRVVGTVPGTEQSERSTPDLRRRADHPFTLTVRVDGAERFATPYSPTHVIEVRERGRDELEIAHSGDASARDFELFLPLRESFVGASVVAHAPSGEPGYFMLLIAPPAHGDEMHIPRDLTLVLDVSGSMSGVKIEQARDALDQILAGLRPEDRFRLITFASVVRSFGEDFVHADRATLREARDYLAGVRAEGSTNIVDALREALDPESEAGRLSLIVFLTDGKPTVGETAPERIAEVAERLRDGERVFAFGVGYDVNTYLLDRLAEGGRGTVSYVQPGDDVEEAVSSLTRKISFPALSDLRIVRAPAELEDFYPNPLPDLFYGEDLILFGRYRGHGGGQLVLEGTRAGETQRFTYEVELPRRENDNDFIPRLWAARKAGALTAYLRLHGADPEVVEEIRQLGLRYGIITEYTSYLVEEPLLAMNQMPQVAMDRAMELAAAPAEATGAEAFKRAEASSRLRDADALEEAELVVAGVTTREGGRGDARGQGAPHAVRHVGRKLFVLSDGTWTDMTFDDSLQVIELAPYSEAYFELARRLPALTPYLALGERVIIAGDGVALELTPDGATSWGSSELRSVLQAFEGSL